MSVFLDQARLILSQVDLNNPEIQQAKTELNTIVKTAGVKIFSDPRIANAINLLMPFVVNYKVNQVIRLLKEFERDKDFNFGSGLGK